MTNQIITMAECVAIYPRERCAVWRSRLVESSRCSPRRGVHFARGEAFCTAHDRTPTPSGRFRSGYAPEFTTSMRAGRAGDEGMCSRSGGCAIRQVHSRGSGADTTSRSVSSGSKGHLGVSGFDEFSSSDSYQTSSKLITETCGVSLLPTPCPLVPYRPIRRRQILTLKGGCHAVDFRTVSIHTRHSGNVCDSTAVITKSAAATERMQTHTTNVTAKR